MTSPPEAARRAVRRARPRPPDPPAGDRPVARVALLLPLAHLDRPFDYTVGESQSAAAVPGARVRARFAGQEVDGFVLDRLDASDFGGRLSRLGRVVSPEPVLAPQIAHLARAVADRWAGTMADVLRLAVPPRHARVEAEPPPAFGGVDAHRAAAPGDLSGGHTGTPAPPSGPGDGAHPGTPTPADEAGPWARYPDGPALLAGLRRGQRPRVVWSALPGPHWPGAIARAVAATVAGGAGALVVVPDARDVARVSAALSAEPACGPHVALTAALGPAERYRRWLAVRRGHVRVVVGTRAATYAPVADLGLVVVWDDGDDLHAEPHAPYAHARDVLLLRAHVEGTAVLVGGLARTAEGAHLVASGWARSLEASRGEVRASAPVVRVADTETSRDADPVAAAARLPTSAWRVARAALAHGPVLVQVPRRGYLPAVACQRCRTPARCPLCAGPLALEHRAGPLRCRWCAGVPADPTCLTCGGGQLRALVVGQTRTAEELGRAFPGVPVRTSGGSHVLAEVPDRPALVVATPGAEPVAAGGYSGALLVDGSVLLARPDLRAGEEALRRWFGAASLVRPAPEGVVVLVADPAAAPVQALVRWDPAGAAERELADRRALRFPPAAVVAAVTGSPAGVDDLLRAVPLPAGGAVLGPTPLGHHVDQAASDGPPAPPGASAPAGPARSAECRALIRVPRATARDLAAALRAAQAGRSARKAGEHVRVQVNPQDLG